MDGREVLKTLVTLLEEQEQIKIKYTIEEVEDGETL